MRATIRPRAFDIPTLDGIRGVAALIVFASHAWPGARVPGGLGVTIFFVLSGLLITTLLRRELDQSGTLDLRRFYLRRALRILPPFYLLLLTAAIAKLYVDPGGVNVKAFVVLAAHGGNYWAILHQWQGMPAATRVTWSLAVEEHFYLVFPALLLWLHAFVPDRRRQLLIVLMLCAAILAWRWYLVHTGPILPVRLLVATDTRIDSILFGCALGLCGNPALDPTRISRRTWLAVLVPAALMLVSVCVAVRGRSLSIEAIRYSVEGLALLPLFAAGVRYPQNGLFRWLNSWPMRSLGRWSYAIYLVHLGILAALARSGLESSPWRAPLALALSIAAAEMIYRTIETPCSRLRGRLGWREIPPEAAAISLSGGAPALSSDAAARTPLRAEGRRSRPLAEIEVRSA